MSDMEKFTTFGKICLGLFVAAYVAIIIAGAWSLDTGRFNVDRARHETVEIFAGGPDPEHGATVGGSGVYMGDGVVLTARHVATDDDGHVQNLWVTTYDGKVLRATVTWYAQDADLAILRIDPIGEPAAAISCAPTYVEQPITVVGNPYMAFLWNVSSGFVATDRPIPSYMQDDAQSMGWGQLVALDVSVSPGNSGGPVFDAKGRVIGILVAKVDGFAGMIPMTQFCHSLPALAK